VLSEADLVLLLRRSQAATAAGGVPAADAAPAADADADATAADAPVE
jgi:hypothetical protein